MRPPPDSLQGHTRYPDIPDFGSSYSRPKWECLISWERLGGSPRPTRGPPSNMVASGAGTAETKSELLLPRKPHQLSSLPQICSSAGIPTLTCVHTQSCSGHVPWGCEGPGGWGVGAGHDPKTK